MERWPENPGQNSMHQAATVPENRPAKGLSRAPSAVATDFGSRHGSKSFDSRNSARGSPAGFTINSSENAPDSGTETSNLVQFPVRPAKLMLNIQIRIGALVRRPTSPLLSHGGSDRAAARP